MDNIRSLILKLFIIAGVFVSLNLVLKTHWLNTFMLFTIVVLSYDLLYGYMGHLSFGHVLFYGSGAYIAAITLIRSEGNAILAVVTAIVFCLLLGIIVGALTCKSKGATFALLNMAFNEIGFFLVISVLVGITKGADGLSCTAKKLFGVINFYNDIHAFIIILSSLLIVFLILQLLTDSPFGALLIGIKENENRVKFLGYNTYVFKIVNFCIAGTIAGFAGSLFAITQGFVSPGVISPFSNIEIIFAVLIGGRGNLIGAILGANILMFMKNLLPIFISNIEKSFGMKLPQWELWLGIILLLIVFTLKQGIIGTIRHIQIRSHK